MEAEKTNESIIDLNIKKSCFGNIICRNDLEKLTMWGRVYTSRGRGKTPSRYTDQIKSTIIAWRVYQDYSLSRQIEEANKTMLGASKRLSEEDDMN